MAPPPTSAERSAIVCVSLALLALASPALASQFLSRPAGGSEPEAAGYDPGSGLLSSIEGLLGSEHRQFTEKRLARLTESMRQTFDAVPKNEHRRLEHAAASYVLHRLFVQRHAWSVLGLDPAGESMAVWNSTRVTGILQDRVDERVLRLFEDRANGRGLDISELAVLAATLEHLVHKEALERLRVAYQAHDFSSEDVLSDTDAEMVMDSYMAYYVMGSLSGSISDINTEKVRFARDVVLKVYPTFNETQRFVREVKERILPNRDYMYFADVSGVVEEIGDTYGRWQNKECLSLKDMLVEFEDVGAAGVGRVRLADFYKKVLQEGMWQLSESLDSLRKMGAIDETDPEDLRVIIPNYIYSPANCVAGSSYYSVCCIDECEDLLGGLERKFASPFASAEQIAAHVAALPSGTAYETRALSAWLLRRLEDVAAHHGGRVPLHGRLFAQWMHYAFPRECRYPHVSGTTDPSQTRLDINNFKDNSATEEEMEYFINAPPSRERVAANASASQEAEEGPTMWTMEEELIDWHSQSPLTRPIASPVVLLAGALAGFSSIAAVLARSPSSGASDEWYGQLRKHYV